MTNIAAALGLAQLEQIDQFLENRFRLASLYRAQLASLEDFVILPSEEPGPGMRFGRTLSSSGRLAPRP